MLSCQPLFGSNDLIGARNQFDLIGTRVLAFEEVRQNQCNPILQKFDRWSFGDQADVPDRGRDPDTRFVIPVSFDDYFPGSLQQSGFKCKMRKRKGAAAAAPFQA